MYGTLSQIRKTYTGLKLTGDVAIRRRFVPLTERPFLGYLCHRSNGDTSEVQHRPKHCGSPAVTKQLNFLLILSVEFYKLYYIADKPYKPYYIAAEPYKPYYTP